MQQLPGAAFSEPMLFMNPAWNILLETYIANRELKQITVGDACIASGAPATTGLRCIAVLEGRGFLGRVADTFDRRRVLVRLTEEGMHSIEQALDRALAIGW
ncbi:winged helix DNA-binding protein [Sphingomonas nostoxanthinifaciens]|uniref:winged helix DNA-binding protein n=1 Tax=Sphingomonas nostoxanthinifaciens TaxID=2872652 RepID=UPI001CC1F8F5|nr:winged helix DNA-binding protein [Sphingomonas nostoxanthinifaciens]UAK25950.1 winged helix DNA-binding protein [Sphingomonas nostoxanthinifaciens]